MNGSSTHPRGEIVVHVFGKSDVGRTRDHNEDAFVVADLTTMDATLRPEVRTHRPGDRGSLFMVADGMGGAAAGELASAMATETVLDQLKTRWSVGEEGGGEPFARAIKAAAEAANARINRYAADHPENRGMGTTATIAGFLGDTLYLAQVGDSRAYLIRGGVAQQLTKDQSLMQKLVEAGELTAEEAEVSERRNIILQALGPEPNVKVDLTHQTVRRGDVLALCSDGLSGQMRASDIARIVNESPDLSVACKRLIDLANEAGGPDNITIVLVRFEGDGLELASGEEGVGHQVYRALATPSEGAPVPGRTGGASAGAGTPAGGPPPAALASAPGLGNAVGARSPLAARRADSPPDAPPSPESRIPHATLRLIFGAIGFLVALALAYSLLRRN